MNFPREVLISEAMLKLSGRKRMHALFRVGKGFQTILVIEKGDNLVLQTQDILVEMIEHGAQSATSSIGGKATYDFENQNLHFETIISNLMNKVS